MSAPLEIDGVPFDFGDDQALRRELAAGWPHWNEHRRAAQARRRRELLKAEAPTPTRQSH